MDIMNSEEKQSLINGLDLASEIFENQKKNLEKIYNQIAILYNTFIQSIVEERKQLESEYSGLSMYMLKNVLNYPQFHSSDYEITVAKSRSIIDYANSPNLANKYISDKEQSQWINELKSLLNFSRITHQEGDSQIKDKNEKPEKNPIKDQVNKIEKNESFEKIEKINDKEEIKKGIIVNNTNPITNSKYFNSNDSDYISKLLSNFDKIYIGNNNQICIGIKANPQLLQEFEKLSVKSLIEMNCSECNKQFNYKNIIFLNCGCSLCNSCLKNTIIASYSKYGFKNLCDSNEKEKFFNAVNCTKHLKKIHFNIVAKCITIREIEHLQFKSSSRIESILKNKKISMNQKLPKLCSICGNVIDGYLAVKTCPNNHFSCRQCLIKSNFNEAMKKIEICPFQECNFPLLPINNGKIMKGHYLSNI